MLSRRTGESPAEIVAKGIELYEKDFLSKKGRLAKIIDDPEKLEVYSEMMSELAKSQSASMSKKERVERARAGAKARASHLTPEQRSAQAKKAAVKRWEKSDQP